MSVWSPRPPTREDDRLPLVVIAAAFLAVKAAFERGDRRAHLAAVPEGVDFLEPAPCIADCYR